MRLEIYDWLYSQLSACDIEWSDGIHYASRSFFSLREAFAQLKTSNFLLGSKFSRCSRFSDVRPTTQKKDCRAICVVGCEINLSPSSTVFYRKRHWASDSIAYIAHSLSEPMTKIDVIAVTSRGEFVFRNQEAPLTSSTSSLLCFLSHQSRMHT